MKKFSFRYGFSFFVLLTLFSTLGLAQSEMSEIEKAILSEINIARTNPQIYVANLEEYKKLFKGKNIEFPDYIRQSFEGTAAVDEAIKSLKSQPKLEPLSFSTVLSKPAKIQLNDLIENPSLGHIGKDGSNLPKRLSRLGIKPLSAYSENVLYDVSLPKEIVMLMIIDDGVKGRGHRKNIFNKSFKQVGIAYGVAQKGGGLTVLVLANSFRETAK